MTLQQLQYLVALAEGNSINQAAQSLFVSQSGISKAIKQLESELRFPLLERSSKGIAFTDRGTEFLRDAYSLMKQFRAMQERYLQTQPQSVTRPCLKNVETPKRRIFFRHSALNFLAGRQPVCENLP